MTETHATPTIDTQTIDAATESPMMQQEASLQETPIEPSPDSSHESSFGSMPGEVSLRGSSFDAEETTATESTPSATRVLTPEQREQKNLRSRERRAAKAGGATETAENAAASPTPPAEMTQAERDMPYRKALSARIQADDRARAQRIQESQQRLAARKPLPANR